MTDSVTALHDDAIRDWLGRIAWLDHDLGRIRPMTDYVTALHDDAIRDWLGRIAWLDHDLGRIVRLMTDYLTALHDIALRVGKATTRRPHENDRRVCPFCAKF